MNRLGLFKRALGMAATPALVMLPPEWKGATPVGVPEPPLLDVGYTSYGAHGYAAALVPLDAWAHTHPLPAHTHTALGVHAHTFPHVTVTREQARALGIPIP